MSENRSASGGKVLRIGDTGSDVVEMQRMLIGWGSKAQPVVLDGIFGTTAESALKRFQSAHNLTPTGIYDELTDNECNQEVARHAFPLENCKCPCGECGGFGQAQFENEYILGKPAVEAYYRYEYPGIDETLIWAVRALMHRAGIPKIIITSGYRCWIYNKQTGRNTTNHLGKAIDFISVRAGEHNRNIHQKIECPECARVRRIGIEECGFQPGWTYVNRVSFEMPIHGAYTWIHIDTRQIPRNLRRYMKI